MATTTLVYLPSPLLPPKPRKVVSFSSPKSETYEPLQTQVQRWTRKFDNCGIFQNPKGLIALFGAGLTLSLVGPASAAELPLLGSSLQLSEPENALSLPTWAVHVSSVVEW
ncbi:hypothetical protein CJ030_MR4G021198 [Morella rubra]|uniref:Uncharacterized protein n=1 Tax=Morella rubra TaxID=262757 RepID=A0A6A1VWJ0_9ROSI|nr:hypothetical protein CJ030_MR4G021198 [Morella rubra]